MAGTGGSPWVVLRLTGELDMSRCDELDAAAAKAFSGTHVNAIFDLSDVAFMDSSALRWLLRAQDRANESGATLRLVAPDGGSLLYLLSLTGLADRFAVFPTREEAEQGSPRATEPADGLVPSLTVIQ